MNLIIENVSPTNDLVFIIDGKPFRNQKGFRYFDEGDILEFLGKRIYNKLLEGKYEVHITKKQYMYLFLNS